MFRSPLPMIALEADRFVFLVLGLNSYYHHSLSYALIGLLSKKDLPYTTM